MAHPNPKIHKKIQALEKFHQAIDSEKVALNEADKGLIAGQTNDIKKKIEGKYASLETQRVKLCGLIKAVTEAHNTETSRVEKQTEKYNEEIKQFHTENPDYELEDILDAVGKANNKFNTKYQKNALQQPMADLYTFINNNRGDAVEILEHCLDEENKKKFFSSMHRILSETNRPFARAFKDNIIKKQTKNTIPKDHTLGSVAGRRIVGAMTLHGYEKGEQGHMTHAFGLEVKHSHDVLHLSIQDVIDAAAVLGLSHQLTVTPTDDGGCKWRIKSGYTSLIRTLRAKSNENKKEVSIEEDQSQNASLKATKGTGENATITTTENASLQTADAASGTGNKRKRSETTQLSGAAFEPPKWVSYGRRDAEKNLALVLKNGDSKTNVGALPLSLINKGDNR